MCNRKKNNKLNWKYYDELAGFSYFELVINNYYMACKVSAFTLVETKSNHNNMIESKHLKIN